MAKGVGDLGTQGFIYATEVDGVSIVNNIINDVNGVREMKLLAVEAAASSAAIASFGSVKMLTIGAGGNVTGIGIAAFNYMANPVDVTGLSVQEASEAVSVEVNSTDQSGFTLKVTASAVNDEIFFSAPTQDGSTPNGTVISPTTDAPSEITFSTIPFAGGAGTNSVFDESSGYRFFLDANYEAAATSCAGDGLAEEGDLSNAIEITEDVIHILPTQPVDSVEIINDTLTSDRKGKEYSIEVNTEGGAATDDLQTINTAGHALGDIIYVRAEASSKVFTAKSSIGNLELKNGSDFVSGDFTRVLTLQLWDKGGVAQDELKWFEIAPVSDVASVSDFRTNSFPFIESEGQASLTSSTGGTTVLTANVSKKVLLIDGASTLTSNIVIDLDTTGALPGDEFFISYQAQIIEGGFEVRIEGATTYIFTTSQALIGGWLVSAYFANSNWNLAIAPDIAGASFQLEAKYLVDGIITPDKLSGNGAVELIMASASFDSDEQGDHKVIMPFDGVLNNIEYAVSKDIQAANDGSIVAKDAALAVMSTTTITSGSSVGTIFSEAPTSNNAFSAGDILTFTSSKSTDGGKIQISIKYTRT